MGKQRDKQKLAIWEQRLARHRASGMTIAAFCRKEGVSDRVFQYWSRRLRGQMSPQPRAIQPRRSDKPLPASERGRTIDVQLGEARFSIPADALDALRLVLNCLRLQGTQRGGETFQQVVVAAR